MAGLLDFLNSDDARLGMGLLAAGGPQTDPTKTGFGYALQSAMNSSDAAKQAALQRQLLAAQAQEAQQKAALDAMNVKRLGVWNQMAMGSQPDPTAAVTPTNLAPTPTPGLLGATPDVGAGPAAPSTLSQPGGGSSVGPQPAAPTAPAGAQAGGASGAFPFKLPGISDQASRSLAMMVGPDAYMKSYMDKSGILSDFAKSLHDAGIQEGSPAWTQAMTDNIKKQNYIPLQVVRADATALDSSGKPVFNAPHVPEGYAPVFDPVTNQTIGMRKISGADAAIAGAQQAKTLGTLAGTVKVGYDPKTLLPTSVTGLQQYQTALGQQPTGNVNDAFAQPGQSSITAPPAAAPPTNAPGQKDAALLNIAMRESGMQNIPNVPKPGAAPSTAEGYFQITKDTWKDGAKLAGVDLNKFPRPMSAPFAVQHAVASALYDARGTQPWDASAANASKFPGAWAVGGNDGGPPPTPAPAAPQGITGIVAQGGAAPPAQAAPSTILPELPAGASKGAELQQQETSTKWTEQSAANRAAPNVISAMQNLMMYAPQAIKGVETARRDYFNALLSVLPKGTPGQEGADNAKTASDLVDKYQSQIVSAMRLGAGQQGTDAFQALKAAGTPGRGMNLESIQEAGGYIIAQQKAIQARQNYLAPAANAAARNPGAYGQQEQAFDANADPRIWQWQSIQDPKQRAQFAAAIVKQDPTFPKKIEALDKLGVLQ